MRGYTLIDMLIVIAVLTTLFAISIPTLSGAADAARLRGAAFHISARLALVRMQAVRRYANVALRFEVQNGQYRYQTFADGDGDGVKSRTSCRAATSRSAKTRASATTTPACRSASFPGVR